MMTELIKTHLGNLTHNFQLIRSKYCEVSQTHCSSTEHPASCGCAVVFALPKATGRGSAWMVDLICSRMVRVLLVWFGDEGESGHEVVLPMLWVRKSCVLGKQVSQGNELSM